MRTLPNHVRIVGCLLAVACVCTSGLAITPRTIDGSNNNLSYPVWGQANTREMRLTSPDYLDGMGSIRTDTNSNRPNAREISTAVFAQSADQRFRDENGLSEMVWAWGQFVDHDIDFTADGSESHVINIMPSDPAYGQDSDRQIPIPRKRYSPGTGTSMVNPRQFQNDITTWIDASLVYGSDAVRAAYGIKVADRLADLMLANTSIPSASIQNAENVMFAQIPEPPTATLLVVALIGLAVVGQFQRRNLHAIDLP